jgi:predicted component of type VI protein secretion system
MQSIDALFNESIAAAVAARTRNQVQAYALMSLSGALTREQRDDNKVTAAIQATIRARDLLA